MNSFKSTFKPALTKVNEFQDEIKNVIQTLNQSIILLSKIENDPTYLFYEKTFFNVLEHKHDFQYYLAKRGEKILRDYFAEQEFGDKITMDVATPNTFPSAFLIKIDGITIMRVNLRNRCYGEPYKPSLINDAKNNILLTQIQIKETEQRLQRAIQIFNEPWKHAKYVKDYFNLIFYIRKNKEKYRREIKYLKNDLEELEQLLLKNEAYLTKLEMDYEQIQMFFSTLEKFFKKFDYQKKEPLDANLY